MLKQRIATALVLLAAIITAMFLLPNFYWALLLLLMLGVGAFEWTRLADFSRWISFVFFCLILFSSALLLYSGVPDSHLLISSFEFWVYAVALVFWIGGCPLWLKYGWQIKNPVVMTIVGWLLLIPTWLALIRLQTNVTVLIAALCVVWVADSAAYLVGRKVGKRKLAPSISPGKTWEGVFGALCAVTVYVLLLYFGFFHLDVSAKLLLWLAIAYGTLILSIEGDLFESWVKRTAGAKDSGKLLPGHGGILDRIDSLTSTAPFVAMLHLLGFLTLS